MNSHRASLLSAFIDYLREEHEWQFNREEFDDRFLLQKYVFFAQELGFPTDYSYGVYVFGAYSPDLAQDYYDDEIGQRRGFESAIKQLDESTFQDVVHDKPAEWLEVASTLVLFEKRYHYLMPQLRREKIIGKTMDEKGVSKREVLAVLNELEELAIL